jgi:hypothetical protein
MQTWRPGDGQTPRSKRRKPRQQAIDADIAKARFLRDAIYLAMVKLDRFKDMAETSKRTAMLLDDREILDRERDAEQPAGARPTHRGLLGGIGPPAVFVSAPRAATTAWMTASKAASNLGMSASVTGRSPLSVIRQEPPGQVIKSQRAP